MEYNTEKNVEQIKKLMKFVQSNAEAILDNLSLSTTNDTLDCMWRMCEMIGDYAEEARILIGKMSDEREEEA